MLLVWLTAVALPLLAAEKAGNAQQTKAAEDAANEGATRIAELVRPSLVKITQLGREGIEGLGSGFVISEDGLIATNMHVVGQGRRLHVQLSDGRTLEAKEVHASDFHIDLAVLRVDAEGLKPLKLGDSDAVVQGQPIVAMGHPQGLEYSVVQGVVSAIREVEGRPMIQVAMPIERGNSGGPLLDRMGNVLGILTLKSMRTENIGFAQPVNDLKALLKKPNRVPMNRWLTIGVLDPHVWSTAMGAQWTQHAGVLKSEIAGDGFGGRTHCIWQSDVPALPYEVAVSVKLDDESGAAGLILCCDKSNRCYGFYPTGGQLRLTRFDGPDVFSWKVFDTVESSAYRAGDWNQLRVRVEAARIICFVNGTRVMEWEDDSFRDGRAGLCKFRSPGAEFKGFRIGSDLRDKPVDEDAADRVKEMLDSYLASDSTSGETVEKLSAERADGRRALNQRIRDVDARINAMKQEASSLRRLNTDLHQRSIARQLGDVAAKDKSSADVLQAALLIARHDNPEIDAAGYTRMLDHMAEDLREDREIKKGGLAAIRRLNKYLFEENGFHGSRFDYDNKANSYVSDVLDNREGLPITLSVIYLDLARRIGLKGVAGMPVPRRFMIGWRAKADDDWQLIDVFEGGKILTIEQAMAETLGPDEVFDASTLEPATTKDITVRMLRNLIGVVQGDEEVPPPAAIPYLSMLIAVEPDNAGHRVMRYSLRAQSHDLAGAREDLGKILDNPPPLLDEDMLRDLHARYERLSEQLQKSKP